MSGTLANNVAVLKLGKGRPSAGIQGPSVAGVVSLRASERYRYSIYIIHYTSCKNR